MWVDRSKKNYKLFSLHAECMLLIDLDLQKSQINKSMGQNYIWRPLKIKKHRVNDETK